MKNVIYPKCFAVIGCSEIIPPAHAWYKRDGNEAVIGCDNSDKEWRLACTENRWIGDVENCTEKGTHNEDFYTCPVIRW